MLERRRQRVRHRRADPPAGHAVLDRLRRRRRGRWRSPAGPSPAPRSPRGRTPPARSRLDHHVGQHQRRRHVVASPASAAGRRRRAVRAADQLRRIARRPWSDADQHAAHIRRGQPRECLDQHALPFQRESRPGSMTTAHARPAAAMPRASRRDAFAADRVRIEGAGSTPRGMTRMRAGSTPWRATIRSAMKWLMAITRSPLRHHRVVAALDGHVLAVGAVISGDELRPGAARGEPGRPGRRARAGMDDVDLLGADQRARGGAALRQIVRGFLVRAAA